MKWLLKWLGRLFLLAVALAVILLLSLDSLLRVYLEHTIRAKSGLEAEIGKCSLGLTRPTVTIRDFKLYNPPDFGGAPFLDFREIHAEYDPAALIRRKLHLTLVRLNLGELDIVKNEAGKTNLFAIVGPISARQTGAKTKANFARQTGFEQMRCAGQRPLRFREIFVQKIGTGLDETSAVQSDTTAQP